MMIIFAPHPDDEVLGCGGLSALKSQAGVAIEVYILTDGSKLLQAATGICEDPDPPTVSRIRKEESRKAADLFGVGRANHHHFDFVDGTLGQHEDAAVERVARVLRERRPDEIYYMTPYEGHPDHVASNRIVRRACKVVGYVGQRFQYIVNLRHDFVFVPAEHPHTRIDIRPVHHLKRQAIELNHSHLRPLSTKQKGPIWPSIPAHFLAPEEIFLHDSAD